MSEGRQSWLLLLMAAITLAPASNGATDFYKLQIYMVEADAARHIGREVNRLGGLSKLVLSWPVKRAVVQN